MGAAVAKKEVNPLSEQMFGHRLLTEKHVDEMTKVPRRKRRQMEAEGSFPEPIRINQKLVLYPANEILAWIAAMKASRKQR